MSEGRVVIAGGTGFIGRALSQRLEEDGFDVVVLAWYLEEEVEAPGERVEVVRWDGVNPDGWAHLADGALAIINLVGENIGTERWTGEKKERILRSRVDAARAIVRAVEEVGEKPRVLIQGSAIAYYGRHRDERIDESSGPGSGFFAEVVQRMEATAREVEGLGVRFLAVRSGVVLGRDGGLLPGMVRSFRRYTGGPTGSGRQWVSWIHIFDAVSAIRFLMDRGSLAGAFNLTAPNPVRQREMCRALGRVMNRPSWLPKPGLLMRLRYGEMADAVLLTGARVIPGRLLHAGFPFQYSDITSALGEIWTRTSAGEGER